MVWHKSSPTQKHEKLHHICKKWCSVTPSDITVRQHQCGMQARAGWPDCALCILPTFTKSCQITKNIDKILQKFFHETIYFDKGPNSNCTTLTYLSKIRNVKVEGPDPPGKNYGGWAHEAPPVPPPMFLSRRRRPVCKHWVCIVQGFPNLPNYKKYPAKLQKILIKFCKSFFMKRFTLTKDPIVIVLL